MGILPLQFRNGENFKTLELQGDEYFTIALNDKAKPREQITVEVRKSPQVNAHKSFKVLSRIDTPVEVEYYRCGGILQAVLRKLA